MNYFTKERIEKLAEDQEVARRLLEFASMDGAAFFEEVRSHLSPEDLEDYLKENPDERKYYNSSEPVSYTHLDVYKRQMYA